MLLIIFQMDKATFYYLVDRLAPHIAKIQLLGDTVNPAKRVAITLSRLVRGDYYYTIAELYGIGS